MFRALLRRPLLPLLSPCMVALTSTGGSEVFGCDTYPANDPPEVCSFCNAHAHATVRVLGLT